MDYPLEKTKGKAENFNSCMPVFNLCSLEGKRGSVENQQGPAGSVGPRGPPGDIVCIVDACVILKTVRICSCK